MQSWLGATIPAVPLAPREKLHGFVKPQGLGGRKQTFAHFLCAKPAPELKYHVAPNQHLRASPGRDAGQPSSTDVSRWGKALANQPFLTLTLALTKANI